MVRSSTLAIPLALSLVLAACVPSERHAETQGASEPSPVSDAAELSAAQVTLLDLAFDAASAFPRNPHLKNRSRAQERVALANVSYGRLGVATEQARQIENWRRGLVYGKVAAARARAGAGELVDSLMQRALGVARELEEAKDQIWRRDRVLASVAEAQLAQGQVQEASAMASYSGRRTSNRALRSSQRR